MYYPQVNKCIANTGKESRGSREECHMIMTYLLEYFHYSNLASVLGKVITENHIRQNNAEKYIT